jgi:hypothetical protein
MPKAKALVCQHLENISREALEDQQEIVRRYVRNRQGVYALYRRGKLYYVGLASNLRSRLAIHLKDRHHDSWDRFNVYITIGDSHLRELEALILRIVKPTGNKQTGKFHKSEDLRSRFKRDLLSDMTLRLETMLGSRPQVVKDGEPISKQNGRRPILAEFVNGSMVLRARYKGNTLRAVVRKSGVISYDGKQFTSPSVAGAYAVKRKSCNGWTFWEYERAPGDWVILDVLRK